MTFRPALKTVEEARPLTPWEMKMWELWLCWITVPQINVILIDRGETK